MYDPWRQVYSECLKNFMNRKELIMQSYTNFEKSLAQDARLFSLSKTDMDLFLLAQTGIITYQQLFLSRLHGTTEAAGRLSLKKLEKNGYIQARILSPQNQNKYFCLTPKGRKHLKTIFPASLLEHYQINPARRPPAGIHQLVHRIRTNDFYYAYLSSPDSRPLPWIPEHPLPVSKAAALEQPARCDGLLCSPYANYYIEQDNSTQSETVLLQKIQHYQQAGIFDTNTPKCILVFSLAFPRKQPPATRPSFSIYRILLRFAKLWTLFEEENGISLDYQQFLQVLESSSHRRTISAGDMQAFINLHALHPEMDTLNSINSLKKAYLDDEEYIESQAREMDVLFQKRLKTHFKRFFEHTPRLIDYALAGHPLFAAPNHRLNLCLPYVMPHEYLLKEQLLKCLLSNGLNTDNWQFHMPLHIPMLRQPGRLFRFGFSHKKYGAIAIEHLSIDLCAKVRLQNFFRSGPLVQCPLFLLLIGTASDIADITAALQMMTDMHNITLLQAESAKQLPFSQIYLTLPSKHPVSFECDAFDEQLRLIPGKEDFS